MRFVNPNFHVVLIHFPLGLFMLGLLIELFCLFTVVWRGGSLQRAGRWMILLGTLLMVPAVTSGIFALRDVAAHFPGGNEQHWYETVAQSGLNDAQWDLAEDHVLFNSIAAAIALAAVVTWIGASDQWRKRLYAPALVSLIVAASLLGAGAWHGGAMVYGQGMGVRTQAPSMAEPKLTTTEQNFDFYLGRMQVHVILAGLIIAVTAAALALSIRKAVMAPAPAPAGGGAGQAATPAPPPTTAAAQDDAPPPARFWFTAAVLAALTIALGFWVGGFFAKSGAFATDVRMAFRNLGPSGQNHRRMGMHIILGSLILILVVVLAITSRCKPRNRLALSILSAVLALVVAGQVWMGTLLLYDTDNGPLTGFTVQAKTR